MIALLPPKFVIRLGHWIWTTMWRQMMASLAPKDAAGAYQRPESQFRGTIAPETTHPPDRDRYELIVGLSCPWAHRTLIVRALKGLETAIPVTIVSPSPFDGGWIFDTPHQGALTLREFYRQIHPGYQGRFTVPVLWDRTQKTIVNNESSEIIVILNEAFNDFAQHPEVDLYPMEGRSDIDSWNELIYHAVNNGVYRCGMAQSQGAYDQAVTELFEILDKIEATLATQSFLCGDVVTLADVRLFTTLVRFDSAYYGLFKCDRRRIADYPHLSRYVRQMYQLPGVAETCDFEAIRRDYYGNLFPLNPGGIIPAAPDLSYLRG